MDITMPIYIPSRSRHHRSLTLEALDGTGWPRALVVPAAQAGAYRPLARDHGARLLPCPAKGIAATRQWIGEHCKTDRFLMLDDDLRFYYRVMTLPQETRLWKCEPANMKMMLYAVQGMLTKFAHVAISAREGNNRMELPFVRCSRPLRALAYRKEPFLECEHGRVDIMEDFDVTLQLLGMGYQNAVITAWAQDQIQTQTAGGCSDYRTHKLHEASVKRMYKLHGKEFISLRQKENKTGGEFGKRLEATIYWQKRWQAAMEDIL